LKIDNAVYNQRVRKARRIPPGRRRVVRDGDEGAAHASGAGAHEGEGLRGDYRRQPEDEQEK
jgi:hypothetical protein